MKTLIILFLITLSLSFSVHAVDTYHIDCRSDHDDQPINCQCPSPNPPKPPKPLFSVTDIKPGYNFYQQLSVTNRSQKECRLYFLANRKSDPASLASVLSVTAKRNTVPLYTGTIQSIFDSASPIYLDTLSAQSTAVFDWQLTMDQNADNRYQNKTLKFDLALTFQCLPNPYLTPTPKPTRIPTPTPAFTPTPKPTSVPYPDCFKYLFLRPPSLSKFLKCFLGR